MAEPWVLGLSASHNGSACILHGDRIVAAIQEERLSRVKRDRTYGAEQSLATAYCLQAAGIRPSELDLVVLCVQGSANSSEHDLSFNRQLGLVGAKVPWLTISHHMGHAVCAFATSGFEESAILVVDGLGSPFEDLSPAEQAAALTGTRGWETISLYEASGTTLIPLEKHLLASGEWLQKRPMGMPRFRSLGGMYSAVATQIFGDAMEAGKVMGLAPYGQPEFRPSEFFEIVDGRLVFHDLVPERFSQDQRWPECGCQYRNLARSVQEALELAVDTLVEKLRHLSASRLLCYSGGVALNCIANEKLFCGSHFRRVYIPPAAEDSGAALGAAYFGLWQLTRRNTHRALRKDALGRSYSRDEADLAIRATPGVKITERGAENVLDATVRRLCNGELGGWFHGGSELGPRALGGRSIIADPRKAEAKELLNGRVKARESFQPFAPAILEDEARAWFDIEGTGASSPFMLRVWPFKPQVHSLVPAVVHVDGTGRVQTVPRDERDPLYQLLSRFSVATGVPILLNTSFNARGEPIVETPEDALWCMLETGLDFTVIDDLLIERDPAISSLLDLVPFFTAGSYVLTFPLQPHEFSESGPAGALLKFQLQTPWGIREQAVPNAMYPLISVIDGVTDGWGLREKVAANTGHTLDPRQFIDALSRLRRASIIKLRCSVSTPEPPPE